MRRRLAFPSLPGYNFESKNDRKHFGISHSFEKIHDGVYYLADKPSVAYPDRYPSLYGCDDEKRIPPWIAYDGQRLMFKAYFQETVQERWKASYQVRIVTISFFLEDATMKIVEPSVNNSGLEQGILVRRQRIPIPDPVSYRFYDVIDLNIGSEPEIYGRVYRIVDCDKFTRIFLNRMGISVPDPIDIPSDPYYEQRTSHSTFGKKLNHRVDTLGKFLKYDKIVLKFFGYWDDTESDCGYIHDLEMRFYLCDDTIEIKEILPSNIARDISSVFIKRMKVPKFFSSIDPIGVNDPFTVLNVLGDRSERSYFIRDSLSTGKPSCEYYKDSDLMIGVILNIFGREVVITDLDSATRDYYRTNYGIEEFKPLKRPDTKPDYHSTTAEKNNEPPPYNGFGSYDDSLSNCFSIVPKPSKIDYVKFVEYDKKGCNGNVLRFRAKMISNNPDNSDRQFIISIYLMDNTVAIFELASRNSGFTRCLFQKRMQVMLPNQDIYSHQKPKFYEPQHFYIGACLNLGKFHFRIDSADGYTLRYIEKNSNKFPVANVVLIMDKLREAIKPMYKKFIEEYQPITNADGFTVLSYEKFRDAMYKYLNGNIVEHEILTIARYYSTKDKSECDVREYIRRLIHTELKRFLWDGLDRLKKGINHWDSAESGFLPRNEVYTILRGCKIPVDSQLIDKMLNQCIHKNEMGLIDCRDLLQYMNVNINPVIPMEPTSIKAFIGATQSENDQIDNSPNLEWCKFINDLDIKEDDPLLASST
ncbi:hypothetical protein PV327_005709 [Microctonus hyperodae]|uniref:EF-hand domain-containing family member C2 n=1 Tax=Microctonus hyperodae TaxID=165561 RepID=A0AA39L047_MICHY|nr:hypothetical protein PV327_005709 [Microctonus hyperodae]